MMEDMFAMLSAMDEDTSIREDYVRCAFGYPGGKAGSIEKILPHLPYYPAYAEPFGGSGAVWLARNEVPLEIYNDRCSGVTAFYRCLKDQVKCNQVIEWLQKSIHSREEFIWCKESWKNCEDDVERAARWYYTVACSFGAQGRNFGRSIKGKAQIGPKLHNNLNLFQPIHNRIRNAQIENLDYRQMFKDYDQEDIVWYLDPPYCDATRGMYEYELSKDQHIELLERTFELKGFVAMSGYSNNLYEKYPWTRKFQWEVNVTTLAQAFTESNNLKGKEDLLKRGKAIETLWIKE